MALTQIQIIQSLGEAMNWLERELGWGVPPTELRHLCGRIGELYTALITNGQIAPEVNQPGYDVVSQDGERVSVKMTANTKSGGHVAFNANTLDEVDRIVVLFLNTDEMQIEVLLDASVADAMKLMAQSSSRNKLVIGLGKLKASKSIVVKDSKPIASATFEEYTIVELESGTILVQRGGNTLTPAKPHLREIAKKLGLSLLNGQGNPLNTRSLGTHVIRQVEAND